MPDDFEKEDEWEGGPIEETPQDEPAPEELDSEQLDAQLADLEEKEGFDEPLIDDPGVSPIPEENQLDSKVASLEADAPFQFEAAEVGEAELPAENPAAVGSELPEDDPEAPPATLEGFYEAGGKTSGTSGSLPGFMPASQDGPMDQLKQYLDSNYSLSQQQVDFLIDHSAQLDILSEGLERGRL
jgi:hypothetical protein